MNILKVKMSIYSQEKLKFCSKSITAIELILLLQRLYNFKLCNIILLF